MSPWTRDERWHQSESFELFRFGDTVDPIHSLPQTRQVKYLLRYLSGLKCSTILLEPHYFDIDYLSEFAEFYCHSARGYPNTCKRLHFFSGAPVEEAELTKAIGGDETAYSRLCGDYLGFAVIRPIPAAPLGRTVIKWFPETKPNAPRIVTKRSYAVHIAGMRLSVDGLAWQQQDSGVGMCATVALWSALQSCAFDDRHAIPTTAQITRAANRKAALGMRDFPSTGLTNAQMLEAIKELGLAPAIESGDTLFARFTKKRFSALCSAFLRSKYPILLMGKFVSHQGDQGRHAICAVGFREASVTKEIEEAVQLDGQDVDVLYVHDDNLGPSVRFEIVEEEAPLPGGASGEKYSYAVIQPAGPDPKQYWDAALGEDPTTTYGKIIPDSILVAVNSDIRTAPSTLIDKAMSLAKLYCAVFNFICKDEKDFKPIGLTVGAHFFKLTEYLGDVLGKTLEKSSSDVRGRVRRELYENVPPMSLYLGVVRIWQGGRPLVDLLFDTTDSDRNLAVFGYVCFDEVAAKLVAALNRHQDMLQEDTGLWELGVGINAF